MIRILIIALLGIFFRSSYASNLYFSGITEVREIYLNAKTPPKIEDLNLGKVWTCREFGSRIFTHGLHTQDIPKVRLMKFENFGVIIENKHPYGVDLVNLYFPDGELMGTDISDKFFETIRITESGKLVLEKSIAGYAKYLKYYFKSYSTLISSFEFDDFSKKATADLLPAISNSDFRAFAISYTVCN